MNFDKLISVKAWSVSTNVKKVQAFLEFVNYNRKFIQRYSQKIMTLTNFTVKNRLWKWDENEQTAFERLQDVYLNNSILRMIGMNSSIRIEIDIFNLVIEVCLN